MELTVKVDMANASASLVERHSLVAGDSYNPLNFDFSSLTPAQIAAIDLNTMSVTVRKLNSAGVVLASSNLFSAATQTASGGTATTLPKIKKTTLLLNTQAVKDWFDLEAASSNPNFQQTVYVELADNGATYFACQMPFVLRTFTVGSTSTGYYTKSEIDALLAAKQGTVTATSPLSKSAQNALSVGVATSSDFGVVKVGSGLTVTNGVLSANDQTTTPDSTLDDDSTNAVQNKPVAEAIEGLSNRLDAILDVTVPAAGSTPETATGRLKTVETKLAGIEQQAQKNVQSDWNQTDTTADDFIKNKPTIPDASSVGNKWYVGTGITGSSSAGTVFSGSGVSNASVGDLYLNSSTGSVYDCILAGVPSVAKWSYRCSIKGSAGSQGVSGQIKATYASVSAMQSSHGSDGLAVGELAIVSTGSVNDEDNGKLYRKDAAQYTFLCDLSGNPGAKWYVGTGVTGTSATAETFPSSGVLYALVGDKYLNTGNGNVYECTLKGEASVAKWSYVSVLKGRPGEDGEDGTDGVDGKTWHSGTAVTGTTTVSSEFSGTAKAGDFYFNTSTGSVYVCSSVSPAVSWTYSTTLKGSDGSPGQAGADGTRWIAGTSVSGTTTITSTYSGSASVGDLYLNTGNGNVYTCTSAKTAGANASWALAGNIGGAPGGDGADGTRIYVGSLVTGTSTVASSYTWDASVGDLYLNSESLNLYSCTSAKTSLANASWAFFACLKGAPGNDGTNGSSGTKIVRGTSVSGTDTVTSTYTGTAAVDDLYLNTSTCDLYRCTVANSSGSNAQWEFLVGLKGSDGDDGDDGTSGTKILSGTLVTGTDSVTSSYSGAAAVGDLYLNTTTGNLYSCTTANTQSTNAVWSFTVCLKGADSASSASDMTGATSSANGVHGLVPAPLSADRNKFLRGDGTWQTVTNASMTGATASAAGSAGLVPAPASGDNLKFLRGDGTWQTVSGSVGKTYDTIYVPASSMVPKSSGGSTAGTIAFTGNTFDIQSFSGAADNVAEFSVMMPGDWDGLAVKAKVAWTVSSGASANQWVGFTLGAVGVGDSSALSAAIANSVGITDRVAGNSYLHVTPASAGLTPGGTITEGSVLHFALTRDHDYSAAGGTTATAAVLVLGVIIQYGRTLNATQWS